MGPVQVVEDNIVILSADDPVANFEDIGSLQTQLEGLKGTQTTALATTVVTGVAGLALIGVGALWPADTGEEDSAAEDADSQE